MKEFRVGHGYDIHRLSPGRRLILGGVKIDSDLGLDGHSDADVVIHALMDSLLGALALGDIGKHFPNTDPAYKNANSLELLSHVNSLIKKQEYSIGNLDITIIAERPKLISYYPEMISNISGILNIEQKRISIKATTNENIGFLGKGEGIAAFAISLLYK
jgi:2-C-methyl-D-erythritol 2,4-cyclodiphosphate synthase